MVPAAVADQPLRHDRAVRRREVLEVGADGAVPVDVRCRGRLIRAGPVERAGDRGPGPLGEPRLQLGDDPADHLPGGLLGLLRHHPVQRQQRADQVHVGLDRLQHLRLQQQPGQVEPLDRVGLHHLHHRAREVLPDVAEPAGHPRRGRAQPGRPLRAGSPARRRRTARPGPRPSPVRAGQRRTGLGSASPPEHQPPAAQPLVVVIVTPPAAARRRGSTDAASSASRSSSSATTTRRRVAERAGPARRSPRRSGAANVAEGTAQQRQHLGERLGRDRGQPASTRPAARSSCTSSRPAAGEEALDLPGRVGGGDPTVSAAPAAARPRRVEPAGVEQQPGQPAGEQRGRPARSPSRPSVASHSARSRPRRAGRSRRARRRALAQYGGRRVGSSPATAGQARRRPGSTRPAGDRGQPGGVGAAHVAVAQRAGQRGQRRHQVADVGVERGPGVDAAQHRRAARRPGRRAGTSTQPVTSASVGDSSAHASAHRWSRRRPPWCRTRWPRPGRPRTRARQRSRHDSQNVPWPRRSSAGRHAPVHAEQPQPVQQPAASRSFGLRRSRSSTARARPACSRSRRALRGEVAASGTAGVSSGTAPEPLAHHRLAGDQLQQHVVAVAQHRPGRLGDLGQPGQRPAAQHGQRLGQPDRLDDVRAGDRQVLGAQHPGDLDQPPRDDWSGAVNRWWYQPGEVTPAPYPLGDASRPCVHGTQVRRPWRFGSPLSSARVGVAGGSGAVQRRHVPRAADHRDPLVPSRSALRSTVRM